MVKPWKDFRSEITRLYITERMTLADVQKQMKERHNFQASIRSYRQHFDQWDLQKYNCKKRSHRRRRQYMMKGMLPSPPYTPHIMQSERKGSVGDELPALSMSQSSASGDEQEHSVVRHNAAYAPHTPPASYYHDPQMLDSPFGYPPMRRDMPSEASPYESKLLPPVNYRSPHDPWLPLGASTSSMHMPGSYHDFGHGGRLPPMCLEAGQY